jgi:hypothetical protein
VGAELFRGERQTDGQDEAKSLFRNFANPHRNEGSWNGEGSRYRMSTYVAGTDKQQAGWVGHAKNR